MLSKTKLLIIDDDVTLIRALELYLSRAGYEVCTAGDGGEGLKYLFMLRPDLVLLDVMMPRLDGLATLQRIREMSTVPVIMLTARGQEADRVTGLGLGADDYVCKPYSMKELVARVEAIMRRTRKTDNAKPPVVYVTDDLVINSERWEVRRHGKVLQMTALERHLLFYLAANAGRVLSRRQLLAEVWGSEYIGDTDYVKLYICRLRKKIEADPSKPAYILTERGIGYRMAPVA